MNFPVNIKKSNACKPFKVTFPTRKEHFADVGYTSWIYLFRPFNFSDCKRT